MRGPGLFVYSRRGAVSSSFSAVPTACFDRVSGGKLFSLSFGNILHCVRLRACARAAAPWRCAVTPLVFPSLWSAQMGGGDPPSIAPSLPLFEKTKQKIKHLFWLRLDFGSGLVKLNRFWSGFVFYAAVAEGAQRVSGLVMNEHMEEAMGKSSDPVLKA